VEQKECPLSLTEDLLLFRINSERIKKDRSHWKQGHSDSIPLLTSNKRIDWIKRNMESVEIDWSRFNAEEAVRELNKEEREKRLGKISMIMELQRKINKLKITFEIIKRQKKEEERRRKEDREQKRREREREEREEQKRVDKEWRRVEEMRI